MKKRDVKAQANIIVTVLLILLVIVAVVIIWNIVNGTIKKSGEQISVNQFILKGEVKYYLFTISDQNNKINVSVHRGAGAGEIKGVKLIFEFSDGTSRSYENKTAYPNELETNVYTINGSNLNPVLSPSNFSSLKKISVYYIFTENNKEKFTMALDSADGPSAGDVSGGGTAVPTTCTVNGDCNDNNICTTDVCNAGTCSNNANTLSCDDGNICTAGDVCSNKVCTAGTGCGSLTCCSSGCVNTQTDNNNCGNCGNVCSGGTPNCINGVCSATISNCWDPIANPIPICTYSDLSNVATKLNKNFILLNDIDASPSNSLPFQIIGTSLANSFSGNFNGNGHTISNLYVSQVSTDNIGLFGYSVGNVSNLRLVNLNIRGAQNVGGLVGIMNNFATITNSSVIGNVSGTTYVGGLVGYLTLSTNRILSSYSKGNVNGTTYVGGLVGYFNLGFINNSYSNANVNVTGGYAGGLVGRLTGGGFIYNSYATGNVSGPNYIGGLIGSANDNIVNSYSTGFIFNATSSFIGGLLGYGGTITNGYWYFRTNGPSKCYSTGNTGCTMITSGENYFYNPGNSPMDSWDFINIWESNNPNGYPTLKWQ